MKTNAKNSSLTVSHWGQDLYVVLDSTGRMVTHGPKCDFLFSLEEAKKIAAA